MHIRCNKHAAFRDGKVRSEVRALSDSEHCVFETNYYARSIYLIVERTSLKSLGYGRRLNDSP